MALIVANPSKCGMLALTGYIFATFKQWYLPRRCPAMRFNIHCGNNFCEALVSPNCHFPCQDAPSLPSPQILESIRLGQGGGGSSWQVGWYSDRPTPGSGSGWDMEFGLRLSKRSQNNFDKLKFIKDCEVTINNTFSGNVNQSRMYILLQFY